MNGKVFFVMVAMICLVCGCKSKDERQKIKFTEVITSYMEKNIERFKVDSISIMGIDSLTDLDFAYFQKIILQNQEEQLYYMLSITPVTDKEFDEQEKLQLQLQNIQRSISQCDSILLDERTDTTLLQYFFVPATVYGKGKDGKNQIHEIGFPITKDFEIKEIKFSD